jgi:hypothetical protein
MQRPESGLGFTLQACNPAAVDLIKRLQIDVFVAREHRVQPLPSAEPRFNGVHDKPPRVARRDIGFRAARNFPHRRHTWLDSDQLHPKNDALTFRSEPHCFHAQDTMIDPSATLFFLVYEEWELAQQRADREWADIWGRVRRYETQLGFGPTEAQIALAVRLEHEASEWLIALRHHLERERQDVQIL